MTKRKTQTSRAAKTSTGHSGESDDPLVTLMKEQGDPLTLTTWLGLSDGATKPLPPELEAGQPPEPTWKRERRKRPTKA